MGLQDLFRLLGIETEEERQRKLLMQQFLAMQEQRVRRNRDGMLTHQGVGGVYTDSLPLTPEDRLMMAPGLHRQIIKNNTDKSPIPWHTRKEYNGTI